MAAEDCNHPNLTSRKLSLPDNVLWKYKLTCLPSMLIHLYSSTTHEVILPLSLSWVTIASHIATQKLGVGCSRWQNVICIWNYIEVESISSGSPHWTPFNLVGWTLTPSLSIYILWTCVIVCLKTMCCIILYSFVFKIFLLATPT